MTEADMNLYDLTIKEAAGKLRNKEISAKELTQACIQRAHETEGKIDALLEYEFSNGKNGVYGHASGGFVF